MSRRHPSHSSWSVKCGTISHGQGCINTWRLIRSRGIQDTLAAQLLGVTEFIAQRWSIWKITTEWDYTKELLAKAESEVQQAKNQRLEAQSELSVLRRKVETPLRAEGSGFERILKIQGFASQGAGCTVGGSAGRKSRSWARILAFRISKDGRKARGREG